MNLEQVKLHKSLIMHYMGRCDKALEPKTFEDVHPELTEDIWKTIDSGIHYELVRVVNVMSELVDALENK